MTRPWDDLLSGEELAFRTTELPRVARVEPLPEGLEPHVGRSAREARHRRPLRPAGRDVGGGSARRERHRHDRHGVGEVARLQPSRPRHDRARADRPGAVPLPDEGADPGSGEEHHAPPARRDPSGDLRRRHRARAPRADPPHGERDPHEPRHAARRDPAPPRSLGRRPPQPALRRRRRGARLSGRLRLARRKRAPAAEAAGPGLRLAAALPARLRHDRESRRARARAHGGGGDRDRDGHLGAGGARRRPLESGPARPGARRPGELALGGVAPDGGARLTRPAHDLLREEPQGDGADPPLHRRSRRYRHGGAPRSLPGRLHALAAARDRGAADGRRLARGLRDRRSRAGDRHR